MRKKIKRNWLLIFGLLFIACFGIMGFYYILFKDSGKFDFKNKSIKIDKSSYKIAIEMPIYSNGKINNEVDKLIDGKKSSFMNDSSDELDEMNVNYSYSIYSKLYTFHYKTLYLKDSNFVKRDDNFKYYDSEKNTELEIDSLITKNDEYYKKLKYVVNNYLKNKDIVFDDSYYENIIFSEDKIYLVVPNDDKDINIPIEYVELKKFLNSDYFNIDGEYQNPPEEKIETKEEEKKEPEKPTEEKKEEPKENTKKKTTTKSETKKTETPAPKEELKSNNDGSNDKITPVVRDAAYFEGKKLICFTFDDGPSKYTAKLLDGLAQRNAKATFFVVGNRVKSYPSILLRMKNEGHTIGQHSWSHKNLKKLDENAAKNEIYLANDAIKSIIGENPRYIRPPYGAYSDATLTYADMVFINWSIDPLDWKYKNADTVYKNIISKAYDGAIILVHDLYGTSVDGALKAMDHLANEGYAFVSIDEMAQLRGYNLQTHHLYNKFK